MSKLSSRDLCFVFNTLSECLLVERSARRSSLLARPRINSSLGCSAGWNLGFGVDAPSYSNDCSPTPAICTTFLVMIVTTQVKQLSRQFIIVTRFFIAGYLIQPTATRVYFWTSGSLLYAPRRFSSTAQPTCQSPLHCWFALLWLRTVAAHVRPHSPSCIFSFPRLLSSRATCESSFSLSFLLLRSNCCYVSLKPAIVCSSSFFSLVSSYI